jgi:hypothetical protein
MSEFNLVLSDHIASKINALGKGYHYIVYTALYGEVDELHDPIGDLNNNALFVCFTDRKDLKSNIWNIIYVDGEQDTRLSAKYWKFFGYKGFALNTQFTIWVDASIRIIGSLLPLLEEMPNKYPNASIFTFHHPQRDCVYSEIFWVFVMGKDSIKSLLKTWVFLKRNNYLCDNGLIAGTVLVRRSDNDQDNRLDKLMSEWWGCVNNYSTRDQLTFNFLADKKKFSGIHKYFDLAGDVYNCQYFQGAREVKFSSKLNPNSKLNLRHRFFHLVMILRDFFKN